MRAFLASLVLLALALGAHGALAGQLVVVDSTAPGFVSGQVLDGSEPVELAAGTRITVIAEDGTVKTEEGPFSGRLESSGSAKGGRSVVGSLSRLIGGGSAASKTIGAMRASPRREPPDPWAVDVFRPGIHCAIEGTVPRLWRHNPARAMTLVMKTLPYGAKVATDWPAGVAAIDWPEGLALEDGVAYLARKAKGMTATRVTLRLVPADLPSAAHRVAWMADAGCTRQAKALLASLR